MSHLHGRLRGRAAWSARSSGVYARLGLHVMLWIFIPLQLPVDLAAAQGHSREHMWARASVVQLPGLPQQSAGAHLESYAAGSEAIGGTSDPHTVGGPMLAAVATRRSGSMATELGRAPTSVSTAGTHAEHWPPPAGRRAATAPHTAASLASLARPSWGRLKPAVRGTPWGPGCRDSLGRAKAAKAVLPCPVEDG